MKKYDTEISAVFTTWFFLRVVTSLVAMLSSGPRPWNDFERQVPIWPPAGEIATWLYRILISPWRRWDADWFEQIIVQGYAAGDGTTNFHPLYAWVSAVFYQLGLNPTVSLMLVGSVVSLALFLAFYFLARLDLEKDAALAALILFATFPVSFVVFAPYTESMFLLWVVLMFYSLRMGRWYWAALFTFLAALTRQQGVFLALPIAWIAWTFYGKSWVDLKKNMGQVALALVAAPAGLVFWALYRVGYLGEGTVDLTSLQSLIYSALLSSSANQVVAEQKFIMPWSALQLSFVKVMTDADLDIMVNLFLALIFVIILIAAWPKMQMYDRVYALAITLISLSYHTGMFHPYMGLPRHMIIAPAVFIGLAARLDGFQRQRQWVIIGQLTGLIFMVVLYVWHAWVP